MAKSADTAPEAKAASPELAHFKAREKELEAKAKRLADTPETEGHDLAGAVQRNDLKLKQVRAEIKRLSPK